MNNISKKKIVAFIPMIVMVRWSFFIMIKSFDTGEPWRIICSVGGFFCFLFLTGLLLISFLKKYRTKEIPEINIPG